jgi:parallel beta-helix repeat protein
MGREITASFKFCMGLLAGLAVLAGNRAASAATLCVDQHPTHPGCFSTIGAAVTAASAGDTIQVAPGRYAEDVHILQPVSLVGAGAEWTIIDAKGLPNGIFIDGGVSTTITPGNNTLIGVTVTGFTVKNANFEGILAANASNVTLWANHVTKNDRALAIAGMNISCPGLPAFETNEGDDCGEGIHLLGTDHSTVAGNAVDNNAGGILLSDDTGPTNANVIQDNEVSDNPFDCGITLASHAPAAITNSMVPLGVFDNTIARNESTENGLQLPGAGAGVGLFAPAPLNKTYGNVVVGNSLTKNGLAGVAIHNHVPMAPITLSDNVITGNYIAGNNGDGDVGTSVPTGIALLGTSAVKGTLITLNQIENESIDIAVNNANAAGAAVIAHLNNLVGRNAIGVANLGSNPGAVDATHNWWGCASGPGARGCTKVSGANVASTPFLSRPVQAAGTN